MSQQCDPRESVKEYVELKTYDFWQQYIEIFDEWGRDKDLIELINSAFDYYYQNDSTPQATKKA